MSTSNNQCSTKQFPDAFKKSLTLRWVSPLSSDSYREYWDSAFLKVLGLSQHCKELNRFWPSGGPHWDALASIENRTDGVLLVESKSHVPKSSGTDVEQRQHHPLKDRPRNRSHKRRVARQQKADWTGPLYQSANRIAHLYFFTEIVQIEAWLVNVYFTNDHLLPRHQKLCGKVH